MRKKNKNLLILSGIILAVFLTLGFLIPSFSFTKNTSLSNDLVLNREVFPNYEEVANIQEGTAKIPDSVDLSKIFQVNFISNACSVDMDIYFNKEKIGVLSFPSCDSLFTADKSGEEPYQHYQEKTFIKEIMGLSANTFDYSFKIDKNEFLDNDLEFSYKVEIIEQVTCTRSSQCSPITINGKEEKPFCSTSHQCTIKLEDKPLVEKQDVRELKPLNIPFWVYPVGAVSVALIIVGMLWYFGGKKR